MTELTFPQPYELAPGALPFRSQHARAGELLDWFSSFAGYLHGENNPYLTWLHNLQSITREQAIDFLCVWYSVSRHQPQILLRVAASFHKWEDRVAIMRNYIEEDGLGKYGDEPHYFLLEQLIGKLGGKLKVNPTSEKMAREFRENIGQISEEVASGLLAGVEHPALDISCFLHEIIRLAGFSELLSSDPYLTIHVDVEPDHIVDAHGRARSRMEGGPSERKEVLLGFRAAMRFWERFWPFAFRSVGYGS